MVRKVVCLGSKPGAVIPIGDVLYCSNTSIGLYEEAVKRFEEVVLVATNSILDRIRKNRDLDNIYRDFNERTWEMFLRVPRKIISVSNKNIENTVLALKDDGFVGEIEHMTKYERRKFIEQISGCQEPIITEDFWILPRHLRNICIKSIVKTYVKKMVGKKPDFDCVLRPSTGILTLVYAISEQGGEDSQYVVAGIGLKKRGEYAQGKNEDKNRQNPYSHIFADKAVLQALAKRYEIFTTEPELMDVLPKFEGWR